MSDKERRKRDGEEQNKQNQARREAESNPELKRKLSEQNVSEDEPKAENGTTPAVESSSPPAAQDYARKAMKGK